MTNLLVHYVQHVCYSLPLRFWTTSQNYYQDRETCLHFNRPFKNCHIRSECTTELIRCRVSDISHKWLFRENLKIGHIQSNLLLGCIFLASHKQRLQQLYLPWEKHQAIMFNSYKQANTPLVYPRSSFVNPL